MFFKGFFFFKKLIDNFLQNEQHNFPDVVQVRPVLQKFGVSTEKLRFAFRFLYFAIKLMSSALGGNFFLSKKNKRCEKTFFCIKNITVDI
jgi:hypothetical protein